jgi:D-glycerate 3-kinase
MALGTQLLTDLRANDRGRKVKIPIFDKSMFSGEGDRSKETTEVVLPLDVVIFEGWCLGFYPLEEDSITQRYNTEKNAKSKPYFLDHSLASLLQINSLLRQYLSWYRHIDAFVLLQPIDLHNVFAWRLQAEHAMKATGKTGMTDEQVHTFVAR